MAAASIVMKATLTKEGGQEKNRKSKVSKRQTLVLFSRGKARTLPTIRLTKRKKQLCSLPVKKTTKAKVLDQTTTDPERNARRQRSIGRLNEPTNC